MRPSRSSLGRNRLSGSSLVEFALGATIMFSIFAGTFQWGYTFYIYNNVQTAVNNGARYAALRVYDSSTHTPSDCFIAAVQNMVAYGDPSGATTNTVAPGLTPARVSVTGTFNNGVPSQLTVGILSYTINAVVTSTTVTNKPQMTYPFMGRFAPGETCVP
jgi:Flp pilus assembly protein TadG